MMPNQPVTAWIAARSRPLPLDTDGPPVPLPATLAGAGIVGLASAVRSARESVLVTWVLLRSLVETAGFRAVFIEGTDATGRALDRFVRTGDGDPEALLAASQGFLRMHEALAVVRWLRTWNERHPGEPVSVVHDRVPAAAPRDLGEIETSLARRDLAWHARTGQRVVHWGGSAHLIVGDPRTVPGGHTHRNAGARLRSAMGGGYRVGAITVGSGDALFPVPPPPRDFAEAAFPPGFDRPAGLLDLPDPAESPPVVRDWLRRPLRTRVIGPVFDPENDHDFRLDAGPLLDCVDVLVHLPRITPTHPLAPR